MQGVGASYRIRAYISAIKRSNFPIIEVILAVFKGTKLTIH